MKILGPWTKGAYTYINYFREDILTNEHKGTVWKVENKWLTHYAIIPTLFSSMEEAMEFVDKRLIGLDYKLLTKEQANQLLILK